MSADIAPSLYSRKLERGLELRFKGLMSVLPPSIHPITHKPYRWLKNCSPSSYALRELQGFSVKRSLGDSFSWETLKERFTEVFGTIEERRYSLEQLLEYAGRKFGKSLQDLQEINDRSWARRKARSLQQNNVVELPTTAEF